MRIYIILNCSTSLKIPLTIEAHSKSPCGSNKKYIYIFYTAAFLHLPHMIRVTTILDRGIKEIYHLIKMISKIKVLMNLYQVSTTFVAQTRDDKVKWVLCYINNIQYSIRQNINN